MPTNQTERMIDWRAMGVRYEEFFPYMMGWKAEKRAHRAYEKAKRRALASRKPKFFGGD